MIKYKNFVIKTNDGGGYVVSCTKTNKNTNEEYLTTICYPSTLKRCIEVIIKEQFANEIENNDMSINEAVLKLENISNEILKEIKDLDV